MIYAADGSIATKDVLPMTWQDLEWLNDGHAFLQHLPELRRLRLDVICYVCHEKGRPDAITVRRLPDERKYLARCRHAERFIPFDGIRSGDELRQLYRWAFRCRARDLDESDCERRGMHYWIEAPNEPKRQDLRLICGCTERIYRMPAKGRIH